MKELNHLSDIIDAYDTFVIDLWGVIHNGIKLNEKAMEVVDNLKKSNTFSFPSLTGNLVDPVGAGDALLAYSTFGLLAAKSIVPASILGSLAAACQCENDGNSPIDKETILKKIEIFENNLKERIG